MNGCIRELKARVGDVGARLIVKGAEQPSKAGLFVGNTMLFPESERMLQRLCKRKELKV